LREIQIRVVGGFDIRNSARVAPNRDVFLQSGDCQLLDGLRQTQGRAAENQKSGEQKKLNLSHKIRNG
jgi:hypothetical protein